MVATNKLQSVIGLLDRVKVPLGTGVNLFGSFFFLFLLQFFLLFVNFSLFFF